MTELEHLLKEANEIKERAEGELEEIDSADKLENFRIKYLGRNGEVAELFEGLKELPNEDKAEAGKNINALKDNLQEKVEELSEDFERQKERERLKGEALDVTLPGRRRRLGNLHVITQVSGEIEEIFMRMGFSKVLGPEIESDYYNFEALNMPELHPARDEWDSFYVSEGKLLRTHTSPVQIRVMEREQPPVKVICPGKCFRRDTPDATHSPVFHQIEMLWVDHDLSLANLKYVIKTFVEKFFGEDFEMRFAADYFPFTEPSAQVHIRRPDEEEWLEIMGAGMVDPSVLKAVDYDPETHQGFAFGLGVERMAMLRYGIEDIRSFYRNDIRFLKQF